MEKTKLTAKEYLSQAYRIDQRISSKILQVQSLRDLATKATAPCRICREAQVPIITAWRM